MCPDLNEAEGACRIDDSRPIACRTYGFFVARDHDQYCQQIETEVVNRNDSAIVWGNAERIRNAIETISGSAIAFDVHYGRSALADISSRSQKTSTFQTSIYNRSSDSVWTHEISR